MTASGWSTTDPSVVEMLATLNGLWWVADRIHMYVPQMIADLQALGLILEDSSPTGICAQVKKVLYMTIFSTVPTEPNCAR